MERKSEDESEVGGLIRRLKSGKQLVQEVEKKVVAVVPPGPTMQRTKGRLRDGGVISVFYDQ